jgi:hypothetical protein
LFFSGAWASTERIPRVLQVIGVMMAVGPFELLDRHPQEFGRLPDISTALHQPSRRCMAQRVRRDIGHPAVMCVAAERLVDVVDRCTVPLNAEPLPEPLPPYMR